METERFDVAILGGGLAGLTLTRLLALEQPGVRVVTLDKGEGPRRKVGESTVEIGAHFLNVRLQLGPLLARSQLPKNGLRFWFDDEACSLPFAEASEDGPAAYAYWRTYQLERETLERLLIELNGASGADHRWNLRQLTPLAGRGGAPHTVTFEQEGRARRIEARWLIDATGTRSLLGRAQGNLHPEERLTHSACWAWFEGAKRLDELVRPGSNRFQFSPRYLSTNHLMGEGYWIWLIPQASGLLSVGLGYDHTVLTDAPSDLPSLLAFFARHRRLRDLLADARPVDHGQLKRFSFRPERYLSPDRVASIGVAAGFVDPFFSNGIDFIALGCEYVVDLVARDRPGEPVDAERLALYERTLELVYEHFLVSVSGLYPTFASHELSLVRYRRDLHVYWNVYTRAYFCGELREPGFLRDLHALSEWSLERGRFFSRLLRHAYARLKERGALRRHNAGRFTYNQLGFRAEPYIRFEQSLGRPFDFERVRRAHHDIDVGCALALMDALFDGERSPVRRLPFEAMTAVYPRLLELEAAHGLGEAFWAEAFAALEEAMRERLAARGLALDVSLSPARWALPFYGLLEACRTPDEEREVRRAINEAPELTEFDGEPCRDEVQPAVRWSAEHTPWLDAPPEFVNVYELLGERWWRQRGRSMAMLATLARETAGAQAARGGVPGPGA